MRYRVVLTTYAIRTVARKATNTVKAISSPGSIPIQQGPQKGDHAHTQEEPYADAHCYYGQDSGSHRTGSPTQGYVIY